MKQYFIKSFGIYKNIGSISKFCDFVIDESTITCTIKEKYIGFIQILCENKFTFEFEYDAKESSNYKTMWQTSLSQLAQILNKQFDIQEEDFYECVLKIGTIYTANEMKK